MKFETKRSKQDVKKTGPEALPVSVFEYYIKAGIKYNQQNI